MKKIFYFTMTLVLLSLVGCSPNTPQGVVKTYLKDIKRGEYENALANFDIRDSLKQADIEVVAGALKEGVVSRGGISKFKIINQTLSDNKNRSEVETKIYYENNTEEELYFKLIKVNRKWKIKAK